LLLILACIMPRIYWMVAQTPVISVDGSGRRPWQKTLQAEMVGGKLQGPATMYAVVPRHDSGAEL
jgi:hypothetical protein